MRFFYKSFLIIICEFLKDSNTKLILKMRESLYSDDDMDVRFETQDLLAEDICQVALIEGKS